MSDTDQDIYREIFFSSSANARDRAVKSGGRFAYYTTSATAHLILKNKELWMRSTGVMNDFSEVTHGLDCLVRAYNSTPGNDLKKAMEMCIPGVSAEWTDLFNSLMPTIKHHTYIISVSEHSVDDDLYGRLSMWRAYGGNSGVAFIFNGDPMFRPSNALKAYSSPVAYLDADGVGLAMSHITAALRKHSTYVRQRGKQWLIEGMSEAFRFSAICTKHPAFSEEREWRVTSTQVLHTSERLQPISEIVGGITQLLLKLQLQDAPEEGLYGITLPDFLDRILIGPCEHPDVIAASLCSLLKSGGVKNAEDKIHITGIPLRPNQR